MKELQGRVAVITGAGSGIGAALAHACSEAGMSVVLSDVEPAALDGVADEIRGRAGNVETLVLDVRDPAALEALAERAYAAFGACHLLVNNAGVIVFKPAAKLTLADWDWVLSVNLHGVIHGLAAFVPRMRAQQGEAHIVNTASINGLISMGGSGLAAYAASKFAVVAITESLRVELERDQIGVSVVCPGGVATRITQSERNRPAEFCDGSEPKPLPDMAAAVDELGRSERILSPGDVAGRILDAVRENELYVITHPDYLDEVRKRHRAIEAAFERAASRGFARTGGRA